MGLLSSIVGIIAGVVTGNPMIGAAVAGGLSMAETGNPFQAFLSGVGAYGMTTFMGGEGWFGGLVGGEAAGATAAAGETASLAADMPAAGATAAEQVISGAPALDGSSMAARVLGVPTQPIDFAQGVADAAGPSAGAGWEQSAAASATQNAALRGAEPTGIIDKTLAFMKDNPIPTMVGMQAVGGVGQGLLQNELAQKKILAERELQDKKLRDAISLEEWRRQFAQQGSYFDTGGVGFKPSGAALRRPGGTPVYNNSGIIGTQIGRA